MTDQLDAFVRGFCARKNITREEFYIRLLGRTARERATTSSLDLLWWMNAKINLNVRYPGNKQLSFFFQKYRESVRDDIKEPDHINFLTALSYKNEGILKSLNVQKGDTLINVYFDQAFSWYKKVNPVYLEQQQGIIGISGADAMIVPRKTLFIYPDLRFSFHPTEPRAFFISILLMYFWNTLCIINCLMLFILTLMI